MSDESAAPETMTRVLIVDEAGKYMGELFLPKVHEEKSLALSFWGLENRRFVPYEIARPGRLSIWVYVEE